MDSEERFLRMKDSFESFHRANVDFWLINVRGIYKKKVQSFLKKRIKKKKLKISFLNSQEGWMNDTSQLLKFINTKLVFFWTEDHICVSGIKYFNAVVNDMIRHNVEYLQYSWFLYGLTLKSLNKINHQKTNSIIYLSYDKNILKKRLLWFKNKNRNNQLEWIISMQSILTVKLFKKIIESNEFTFFKKNNPFSFEKNTRHIKWLPYKLGLTKKELFASIDSDHDVKNYSLISRGIYLPRKRQSDMHKIRSSSGSIYNIWGIIYFSKLFNFLKIPLRKFFEFKRL